MRFAVSIVLNLLYNIPPPPPLRPPALSVASSTSTTFQLTPNLQSAASHTSVQFLSAATTAARGATSLTPTTLSPGFAFSGGGGASLLSPSPNLSASGAAGSVTSPLYERNMRLFSAYSQQFAAALLALKTLVLFYQKMLKSELHHLNKCLLDRATTRLCCAIFLTTDLIDLTHSSFPFVSVVCLHKSVSSHQINILLYV